MTYLAAPDGSCCEVTREPDAAGRHAVRQAGPTRLWPAIETAYSEWNGLGNPEIHEFGLTATPDQQVIWHRDPDTGAQWPLPQP